MLSFHSSMPHWRRSVHICVQQVPDPVPHVLFTFGQNREYTAQLPVEEVIFVGAEIPGFVVVDQPLPVCGYIGCVGRVDRHDIAVYQRYGLYQARSTLVGCAFLLRASAESMPA